MKKLLLALLIVLSGPVFAADQESAYDRVMRTGILRCGYLIEPPMFIKDANSGEMKGISHDLVMAAAEKLGLKVEWSEQASWGTIIEGLLSHRYDLICSGLAMNAARAKSIAFSQPYFFLPMYMAVRADESRFTHARALNDPQYTVAVLEGDAGSIYVRQNYPKAAIDALPQMAELAQLLEDVKTKKADAAPMEPATFARYDGQNPGALKLLDKGNPLVVYGITLGLPNNDMPFKTMIDGALSELLFDGTAARLIDIYEETPGTLLRPGKPYEAIP